MHKNVVWARYVSQSDRSAITREPIRFSGYIIHGCLELVKLDWFAKNCERRKASVFEKHLLREAFCEKNEICL